MEILQTYESTVKIFNCLKAADILNIWRMPEEQNQIVYFPHLLNMTVLGLIFIFT